MGIALIITATLLSSLKGIFTQLAYQAGAGIDATLLLRFIICLPFAWGLFLWRKKHPIRLHINKRDLAIIATLSLSGYYIASKSDYIAISLIGAGLSRMILFIFPIFVILFNAILHKTYPTKTHIILALLMQIGLIATVSGGKLELLELNLTGGLFALVAAIAYAAHLVLLNHKGHHISSRYLTCTMLSFACLYMAIDFSLTNHISELFLNFAAYFWITTMALVSTVLPITMFTAGLKKIGSDNAALMSSCSPIFSLTFAYLILGETYNFIQLFGAILIVVCVYRLGLKIRKKEIQPPNS